MKRHAIYPGSFDPLTNGHVNVIERGLSIFETVTVAVARDTAKRVMLNTDERIELIKRVFKNRTKVRVEAFSGLLVDFVSQRKNSVVIRGIRSNVDFEYELTLAQANRHLNSQFETVFMLTDPEFAFLSSSMIREIITLGGSTKGMVPDFIEKKIREKLKDQNKGKKK